MMQFQKFLNVVVIFELEMNVNYEPVYSIIFIILTQVIFLLTWKPEKQKEN